MPVLRIAGLQWKLQFWSAAGTLFFLGVLIVLGFWQIDRAHQKEHIMAAQKRAEHASPVNLGQWLTAGKPLKGLYLHHVRIQGLALENRVLLQDEQPFHARVGYHVWVPVELSGAPRTVLINRGWIPKHSSQPKLHSIPKLKAGGVFTGVFRKLPRSGLNTAGNHCMDTGWPHVVLYPRVVNLQCLFREPLVDGIVQLDNDSPGALGKLQHSVPGRGLSPMRHYGYALQWFALAVTLLVIYVALSFRRMNQPENK